MYGIQGRAQGQIPVVESGGTDVVCKTVLLVEVTRLSLFDMGGNGGPGMAGPP